jgi:hypothetical protein
MNILGIISGLQALGNLFGANEPPALTPAQAEGEKPKRKQQPNTVVILPTPPQPQPMAMGVPPSYWSELPPANVLRNPLWYAPPPAITVPPLRGVPQYTNFPTYYPTPSLQELYDIYFGTRR